MTSAEDMRVSSKLERIRPRRRCKPCSTSNSSQRCTASSAKGRGSSSRRWCIGVDTRLSKPMAFDGREGWRSFKFLAACCGATAVSKTCWFWEPGTSQCATFTSRHASSQCAALHADHGVPGAQKLLEHAGDTEGGVARRLLDEYEPRTAGRQCALLQELLHYGFPETHEQPWMSSRCCFAGTPRCLVRTSARA